MLHHAALGHDQWRTAEQRPRRHRPGGAVASAGGVCEDNRWRRRIRRTTRRPGRSRPAVSQQHSDLAPAGAISSTARDMITLTEAALGHRIVSGKLISPLILRGFQVAETSYAQGTASCQG